METKMTNQRRTFLVLSGKAYRNYIDFWIGFVNIQRALNTEDEIIIVGHTWDESDKDLITKVYGTELITNDHFVQNDDVERALDKLKKTLSQKIIVNEIPNLVFMNQSRRYALEKLVSNYVLSDSDRILITRYDLGYRKVTPEVSEIVIDDALPRNYVYFAYYHEIDEGYGDQWIVFNNDFLDFFIRLDSLVLKYLSSDDYYYSFTTNWINSNRRPTYKNKLFYYKKYFINKIITLFEKIQFKSAFFTRKKEGMLIKLRDNRDLIQGTAEIELPYGKYYSSYPLNNVINNHALLKYAIYNENIRKSVRFLDYRDFSKNITDRLINPQPLAILIYSHSSYSDCWEMTINQFKLNLNYPRCEIFLATEESESSNSALEGLRGSVTPILYSDTLTYTARLRTILSRLSVKHQIVYFVHEDMPLYSKVDLIYLNSLIKFMLQSEEYYIKLVDTNYVNTKSVHLKFPDLVSNSGFYSLSIQPSLIKANLFLKLIDTLDLSIYEFENYMHTFKDSFSAVKGEKKVGKFLLINNYFPHIATALYKGKWMSSEWGSKLSELLIKYRIDENHRGRL